MDAYHRKGGNILELYERAANGALVFTKEETELLPISE